MSKEQLAQLIAQLIRKEGDRVLVELQKAQVKPTAVTQRSISTFR